MDVVTAINELQAFSGIDVTQTISETEARFGGLTAADVAQALDTVQATSNALSAAHVVKRLSRQVDVKIHALGILRCLPHLLGPNETIQYLSLGAGNTGREFDLETDRRVAEFKFISWQGGAESIRQNGLFKDYFQLVESSSTKAKFLYVLRTQHPLAFFNGGRAIQSVFASHPDLLHNFRQWYLDIATVREYFALTRRKVTLVDVSQWVSELCDPLT
jgi:hypothetical protein